MKVVGVIAEYNPFHNGHAYHIAEAKRITGADYCVVVMSGDFVQRGEPAIFPKQTRRDCALRNGADLVLEIPVVGSTGSAELFALSAVALLDAIGVTDYLAFGSETTDLNKLKELAGIFAEEPSEYQAFLKENLRLGLSYPLARAEAVTAFTGDASFANTLSAPNSILGIEYCKAIQRLGSRIQPVPIRRASSGYNDQTLKGEYASALAIRGAITGKQLKSDDWLCHIPENTLNLLPRGEDGIRFLTADDFSLLTRAALLTMTKEKAAFYSDVTPELAARISHLSNDFHSYTAFCQLVKTKSYTYTRISRSLLHILLGVTDRSAANLKKSRYASYARVLGFRGASAPLLGFIKDKSRVPLITKLPRQEKMPSSFRDALALDIHASRLYQTVLSDKYDLPYQDEYAAPITVE